MAPFDARRLAARAAGRPLVPEYSSVTGAGAATNVALTDRTGSNVNVEDMILNVFDTSTAPWSDITSKFSVTSSGNIQSSDGTGNTHTLFVIWLKARPGL